MKKFATPLLILSTMFLVSCDLLSGNIGGNTPSQQEKDKEEDKQKEQEQEKEKEGEKEDEEPKQEEVVPTALTLHKEKLEYFVGAPVDLSDLSATITYSNETEQELGYSDFASEGIKYVFEYKGAERTITTFNRTGEWTLIAYLEAKPAIRHSLAINVIDLSYNSITIDIEKTAYFISDTIDYDGLTTTLSLTDGTTKEISYEEYSSYKIALRCEDASGNSYTKLSKVGTYSLFAKTDDGETLSNVITLTVTQPDVTNIRISKTVLQYEVDETISYDDLETVVTYENDRVDTFSYDYLASNGFRVRLYDTTPSETVNKKFTKAGTYHLDVIKQSTGIVSNTLDVVVTPIPLTAIKISKTKTNYYAGDDLDISDLSITLSYRTKNETISYDKLEDLGIEVSFTKNGEEYDFVNNNLTKGDYLLKLVSDEVVSNEVAIKVYDTTEVVPITMKRSYQDLVDSNPYGGDMSVCPSTGNANLLVIPVWFSDSDEYINESKRENVRDDIRKAYLGTKEEIGFHSVKSFYEAESFGAVSIDGVVSDWYEISNASSDFYSDGTTNLVVKAVNWFFENNRSYSRKDFDCNEDGFLDGVMLIYGCPNHMSLGISDQNLWAYKTNTWLSRNTNNPAANVYFWASYDFMYNRETAYNRTGMAYGYGDSSRTAVDTHTFIHEMGHVFGANDYYDYSSQYSPAYGFSMQDSNVGGHDPYSLLCYNWASAKVVDRSITITLNSFQETHEMLLLSADWNEIDSPFDEYLLLEYYTPTGLNKFDSDAAYRGYYPQGPSVPGIRLWHVDAVLYSYRTYNLTLDPRNNNAVHYRSNTYPAPGSEGYGDTFYDFNELQLISRQKNVSHKRSANLSAADLFVAGDKFSMEDYQSQFVRGTKLNYGLTLGYTFEILENDSSSATIQIVKL